MRAFEVFVNGQRVVVAGIADRGVMTALVRWNSLYPPHDYLSVAGLNSVTREHLHWREELELLTGDEVTIRLIEVESVDPPTEIKTYESKRASDTSGTNH